jgi:hypothetical protein
MIFLLLATETNKRTLTVLSSPQSDGSFIMPL